MGWLENTLGYGAAPGLGVPQLQNPLQTLQSQPGPAPAPRPAAPSQPDAIAQTQKNAGMEVQAAQQQAAAEKAQNLALAEGASLAEAQRSRADREQEEARTRLYSDVDKRQQGIIDEASRMPPIDPGKFAKDLGAGGAIAAAATGFLSGLINPKGGADDIVNLITGLADRNVQAQLANNSQREKLLGLKQQALNGDFSRGRDLLDAKLAATARAYDGAIRLVKAEADKKWGGQIGDAKAQGLITGIQQKFVGIVEQIRDTRINQGVASMNAQSARMGAESGRMSAETGRASQREVAKQNEYDNQFKAAELGLKANAAKNVPVPGSSEDPRAIHAVSNQENGAVRVSRPEAADKLNERIGAAKTVLRLIDRNAEIRRQIKGGGIGVMPDDLRKEAESNFKALVNFMSSSEGQGVVRKEDYDAAAERLGDPSGWYDIGPRLEATRKTVTGSINDQIESLSGTTLKHKWGERLSSEEPGGTDAKSRLMVGEPGL